MLWNELPYEIQLKVLEKISDSLVDEENEEIIDGVMAAVHELQLWSNSPCEVHDPTEPVQATEQYSHRKFGKH